MNEDDYKSLITTYQRKSMDLFAQLVVAETKVEVLSTQLKMPNRVFNNLKKR